MTDLYELVGGWPADRSVPKQLRRLYDAAAGQEREQIGMMVEALMVAAENAADIALVRKYFGR